MYGCASNQAINPDAFYKRDMLLTIDGVAYEGTAVLDERLTGEYSFLVEARGDLDLFTIASCAKLQEKEKSWGSVSTKINMGLWKREITDKRKIKFDYSRNSLERKLEYCHLYLEGLDEKGRHSWAFVDFKDAKATLPAWISCNTDTYKADGVSVCQNRAEMWMQIIFEEPVMGSSSCNDKLELRKNEPYLFQIKPKQCVYTFTTIAPIDKQKLHRLTTLGYEDILLRK